MTQTTNVFRVICGVLFAALVILAFLYTGLNSPFNLDDEYIYFREDSPLWNLTGFCLAIGFLYLAESLFEMLAEKFHLNMEIAAAAVSLAVTAISIFWIQSVHVAPRDDQEAICSYASAFNQGDFSGLAKGGYVGIYRQQLGLITIMRLLFLIFGDGNYVIFQYLSAALAGVMSYSGYRIVKCLAVENKKAEFIYLTLMLLCYPMYGYTPFVYGDLCSTAMIFFAAWMFLESLQGSIPGAVGLGVGAGIAVQMRANAIIFVIAFACVLAVKAIQRPGKNLFVTACVLLIGCGGLSLSLNAAYRPVTPADSEAMPAILWSAMGCRDGASPGWFTGYSFLVFHETDYDARKAREIARQEIRSFAGKCGADPSYAANFFCQKFATQWNAPTYQVLPMNNYFAGPRNRLAESVYFGKLNRVMNEYMNIYQLVTVAAVLLVLIFKRTLRGGIESYVLLIGIFGGFLFSMAWEAKTRYTLPYFLAMIPYAAIGAAEMLGRLSACLKKVRFPNCH